MLNPLFMSPRIKQIARHTYAGVFLLLVNSTAPTLNAHFISTKAIISAFGSGGMAFGSRDWVLFCPSQAKDFCHFGFVVLILTFGEGMEHEIY